MFKNYIKTALRNIKANRLFSSLNIAGLAMGLCVCLLLFAYIFNELSFDRMFKNYKNIYRVNLQTTSEYNNEKWAEIPNAVSVALVQDIPQVKYATRLIKDDFGATASVRTDDKNFVEKGLYLADSSIFKIFNFHFIAGDVHSAFSQPHSIVLSQSAKEKLFGNGTAMGKLIYVNNRDTLQVSGIYKDLSENSTIDCDMIYNIMDSWMGKNISWSNASFETYCLLQPNSNVNEVQKLATGLINKNVKREDQYFNRFIFQPLSRIHLYSSDLREGYSSRPGNINTVKELLFLSFLVLLIACINYMNLATARSQKRAKSVGVNKVLGANRRQITLQFFAETSVLTFISIAIGYVLAYLLMPVFLSLIGVNLNVTALYSWPVILSLIVIWLLVTFVAGSYPAVSMSHISPLVLIKKQKEKNSSANLLRKSLVIFQFASSIILILAVIIIIQQMRFIRNKNLGYNPKGVIALSIKSAQDINHIRVTVNELKNMAEVKDVSLVQSIPGETESGKSVYKLLTDKTGFPTWTCRTDGSIVSTLQLNLLAGKSLPAHLSDGDTTCYVLINESVANYLGFKTPADAVGKFIITEMSSKSLVTGVVKNFNYHSLKDQVGGYLYYEMKSSYDPLRTMLVRYSTHNLTQLVNQLRNVFKNDLPEIAFDYQFLDKHVQNLYTSEQHTANAVTIFSILAVVIACLGLFGLVAFSAEQRTKEIGIRKVLGASVSGITKMITSDFLKLIFISFVIAVPVAWWTMKKWLQGFAYRIDIQWWVFLIAGVIAVFVALITICYLAIKAALANPVDSLRTE